MPQAQYPNQILGVCGILHHLTAVGNHIERSQNIVRIFTPFSQWKPRLNNLFRLTQFEFSAFNIIGKVALKNAMSRSASSVKMPTGLDTQNKTLARHCTTFQKVASAYRRMASQQRLLSPNPMLIHLRNAWITTLKSTS